MSSTSSGIPSNDEEAALKDELATLRIVRATLESMKQLVGAIHEDIETAAKNCEDVTGLHKRWDLAIEQSRDVRVDQIQSTSAAQKQ
ncbi:uncharacterized protein LAJ45_11292 [Morchella importuna]|uniref:DASH complex subunit DAD2 n=1 Tax=Morchella conica CCBAS932 TaxID=1392247 RepID=A0A3N4KHT1_9PEZI|nr:uncharacterized protein LAJ45_11292 [Morchella importuna]KAH8144698.1 hypothetical protein LAJ45_11292 [Morchella importuna]RPB10107.1 hypothetical protein P167DRAFT_576524 [Morchella conica CCBAS932]